VLPQIGQKKLSIQRPFQEPRRQQVLSPVIETTAAFGQ
jgi:hypothetical protein